MWDAKFCDEVENYVKECVQNWDMFSWFMMVFCSFHTWNILRFDFLINLLSLIVTFMKALNLWSHRTLDIMDFDQSSHDLASSLYHIMILFLNLSIFGDSFSIFWFLFAYWFLASSLYIIFWVFFIIFQIIWFLLLADSLSFIQFFGFTWHANVKNLHLNVFTWHVKTQ